MSVFYLQREEDSEGSALLHAFAGIFIALGSRHCQLLNWLPYAIPWRHITAKTPSSFDASALRCRTEIQAMLVGCAATARDSGPRTRGSATSVVQLGRIASSTRSRKHRSRDRPQGGHIGPPQTINLGEANTEKKPRGSSPRKPEAEAKARARDAVLPSRHLLHHLLHRRFLARKGNSSRHG